MTTGTSVPQDKSIVPSKVSQQSFRPRVHPIIHMLLDILRAKHEWLRILYAARGVDLGKQITVRYMPGLNMFQCSMRTGPDRFNGSRREKKKNPELCPSWWEEPQARHAGESLLLRLLAIFGSCSGKEP